jgi:hypothetical protein
MAEEADALSMSKFFSLDITDISLACVCYVGQPSSAKVQDAVRRLNKKNADARFLLAFLASEVATPMVGAVGAEVCSGSFGAALEAINQATTRRRQGTVDSRGIAAT